MIFSFRLFFIIIIISYFTSIGFLRADSARKNIVVYFGENLSQPVQKRLLKLLSENVDVSVEDPNGDSNTGDFRTKTPFLTLSFGDTPLTRRIISKEEISNLPSEGFIVRSQFTDGHLVIAADGASRSVPQSLPRSPQSNVDIGAEYAAYSLMEHLGYSFLHQLSPTLPEQLESDLSINIRESPKWHVRGFHLHTMHPIELANVLNGWGIDSPDDVSGWTSMLSEWESYLEWLVANRQNQIQWVLLSADSWKDFTESSERQTRLRKLVETAHAWGLDVGIDVGLVLTQQHNFCLLNQPITNRYESIAHLKRRIDWLLGAGFDYLVIQNGTSEFSHINDKEMLFWMNEATRYVTEVHQKKIFANVHITSGQTANSFVDPRTGKPLNYNFLPHFADRRLGILPHTVQFYALDEPSTPTYGNKDFSHMFDFLKFEIGQRDVVWHPETSYWVSFDIDVPLFLPIYAAKRFHDARLLSRSAPGLLGQINFSSGWEWGYWLNDVVTARAAWNPILDESNDMLALRSLLKDALSGAFHDTSDIITDLLLKTIDSQQKLLIEGNFSNSNSTDSADINMRNGQAYLQGSDALDDIASWAERIPYSGITSTQPKKLGLVELRYQKSACDFYEKNVKPILIAMDHEFSMLDYSFKRLEPRMPPRVKSIFQDFSSSITMTSLRAKEVRALYEYVAENCKSDFSNKDQIVELNTARDALATAMEVVNKQQSSYRVAPDRLQAWKKNPTAYSFLYLWTVKSLYYWRRDYAKATETPLSPCFRNILNPWDVSFGEGMMTDISRFLRYYDYWDLGECLAEPSEEPFFDENL